MGKRQDRWREQHNKWLPETPEEWREFGGEWHLSYSEQRTPQPSNNMIVRIIDRLYAREIDPMTEMTRIRTIRSFIILPLSFVVLIVAFIFSDNPFPYICWTACYFMYTYLNATMGLDFIYRILRNKYFKTHGHNGPYGWGTLDEEHDSRYETHIDFSTL